uniref:Dynein regulatory complex protein 1 n=1 Tax=Melopsittacus undulatus TaxID=13146 RepID=A0A8C6JJH1_MELUD
MNQTLGGHSRSSPSILSSRAQVLCVSCVPPTSQRLAKLQFEGTQMVTNIQVAADLRETQRRAENAELKLQRMQKLENEAKSSTQKFAEITSKWALAKDMTIPQDLWQLLNQQQQLCVLLLEQKNKLISELQQELKNKDEQYVQAIKKQSEDIHLLLERMEEQIRTMLKTYRHNFLQIEKAFEEERRELLDSHRKKWEEAIQAHNAQEMEYLSARMRKVEEFEKQLTQLRLQDEEEYNNMKMQLENDVENLERQLQQMKAVYLLNQEKLDFNLQVLKKRDEENIIIRAKQKRKLNRLHSLLNNLKIKLANREKQFREEKQSMAADCERIRVRCKDLHRRMRWGFAVADAEKFMEVWLMNEAEAKGLMRKVLNADRIIHIQQLGLPWEEPHYWFLNNVGPLGHYKMKRRATKLAAEVLTEEVGSSEGGQEDAVKVEGRVTALRNISKKTAKRILELVSQESGYPLLLGDAFCSSPPPVMSQQEADLVPLPPQAIGINSEDDLYQLLDFFLKYKSQEVAASQVGSPGTAVRKSPGVQGRRSRASEHPGRAERGNSVLILKCFPSSLPSVHIHTDDVLKILKAFVEGEEKEKDKDKEVLQVRDSSKDGEYWEAVAHVIPETTLKLWDALAAALEDYYGAGTTMNPLAILLTEAAILQQQNSELHRLLEEYINSGVSAVPSSSAISSSFIHPVLCAPHRDPRHGVTAQSPSLPGSGGFSLQLNSKLICPPTQWMDLNLS